MRDLINTKGVIDLEYCFLKCKVSYQACINISENKYLRDDIEVPINELVLQDDSVKIFIDSKVYGESIIAVRINLFSSELNKSIGYYRYIENIAGEPIDDFLAFE